ncbi:MAG: ComEA family DNA-binding protein [Betaproteobacteria bacterium]
MAARGLLALAVALALPVLAWALEINDASRAELERLDGVGVATANRILEERERGGAFRDWADLAARVPGLRGRNLERLKREPRLTVGGQPATAAPDSRSRPRTQDTP